VNALRNPIERLSARLDGVSPAASVPALSFGRSQGWNERGIAPCAGAVAVALPAGSEKTHPGMSISANLIDRYRFMVHAIVLGKGRLLFQEDSSAKLLTLVETKSFKSGIVIIELEPAK
jgi:hypothetical protein